MCLHYSVVHANLKTILLPNSSYKPFILKCSEKHFNFKFTKSTYPSTYPHNKFEKRVFFYYERVFQIIYAYRNNVMINCDSINKLHSYKHYIMNFISVNCCISTTKKYKLRFSKQNAKIGLQIVLFSK